MKKILLIALVLLIPFECGATVLLKKDKTENLKDTTANIALLSIESTSTTSDTSTEGTSGTTESETSETEETEETNNDLDNIETYEDLHEIPKEKKTIYNMTTKELNALSIKQKAKLVGISVKEFKMMAEVISHEAGLKMNDKICVAATIWNRKYCKQFNNSIKGVITEPGQFYDLSRDKSGNHKDKKAQLAILLAYRKVHKFEIPHNVLYFNSIGFGSKNRNRYKKYKHYNNYFLKDTYCHCKWCSAKKPTPKPTAPTDNVLNILDHIEY